MTTTAAFIPFGNSAPKITKELALWLQVISHLVQAVEFIIKPEMIIFESGLERVQIRGMGLFV